MSHAYKTMYAPPAEYYTLLGEYVYDGVNASLGHTTAYTYDHLNRLLTSVATPIQSGGAAQNLTFSYDNYGNMTCVQNSNTNGPCPQWSFNSATNQITNPSFTYDASGDLTNDGTHTYQWDAEGRLKSVDSGSTADYNHNALGWRVEKKLGSVYTEYLRGAQGEDLGENNRTTWVTSYVPLGAGHYAIYQNNAAYFTHPNTLGSTSQVSDYNGNVVQDRLFYPFGQDWALNGTLYDERFASLQHRDTETGLDPTPNRMFASGEGRWLSPDPLNGEILDPQSLNRYAYVVGSPTGLRDPTGLTYTFSVTSWAPYPEDPGPQDPAQYFLAFASPGGHYAPLLSGVYGGGASAAPFSQAKYKSCCQQVFGKDTAQTSNGTISFAAAADIVEASTASGEPATIIGATLLGESSGNLAVANQGNSNGTVDVGPMQLNSANEGSPHFPAGAYGNDLKVGDPFSGNVYQNILAGAIYLATFGANPQNYVSPNGTSQKAIAARLQRLQLINKLSPSLNKLFDCLTH